MTDNTLPEVGSRWTIDGQNLSVLEVKKKGRGHYVVAEMPFGATRYRLKDFQKKAKAVTE